MLVRKFLAGVNHEVAEVAVDFRSILDEVHMKLRRDTDVQLGLLGPHWERDELYSGPTNSRRQSQDSSRS